ncbi:SDR family NAD(P)-dependent oxidoreductase [Streptomonospora nanhaiensis]|uniref:NAD(P)-dependent dehydrogenase (Short-subunit alcohol dehydrogenase family) n=1 Tax=Streptomonospora nanhaiensis TaxID=1323731 RepID=A0A853BTV1_9ACTN|nr:SDR family NAD(P)-dependent oxidoreductase [Streptomonospora nanhaiensis]MBV2365438.1 SDR family NAD(P)-dependent oxidoreductase [Streptomonospora nanhaiensis]MBX9389745.1 SDR family NAD(P)-dependent oxidoreductase [Streptomonospora nanhaiensis]NYI98384.1 NAD(P)-dependent dehydrogenase (short-subunit alcohol dehydrogenase family) [Streptomonospora nanhaiensis]
MSTPTDRPATWFVTGASRGLGLELVAQLLERGERVAATTRSTERLLSALGDRADTARLLPLAVDLTDEAAVRRAVEQAAAHFGALDVVVNNAGYGFLAAVEETGDREVRAMLDVQVVGVWNVLRAALPILRRQRGGHIVNVSSVLGLTAVPGWALYCAGKFALEGLSEALAAEVADFGIGVTIVEPGYFRTAFLSQDSIALPAEPLADYPAIRRMTADHLKLQGGQLGDPVRGAAAIIDRVAAGEGPLRQLLGSDAHAYATAKVEALRAEVEAAAQTAPATDFPAS